ncbi:OST-HTH/LOTUS domain-containing protein [uncultured Amaricoccus sp.]|uniref:OST-HTH/LOTUS domain-containing protein n=1 Tax=uncultured Amaricoccus sp. TaxID=339341 RepID=UPI00260A38A0|nr:OST-HTH/LOTUS domain-containing protein [uncultured Amaricoccus sp.]
MTTLSDEALPTHQREVQRLLGRCLLRLQQYERGIKAIVAHHEITGPADKLEEIRAARIDSSARKTLGMLVGDLLGSYVTPNEIGDTSKDLPDCPAEPVAVSFRMGLSLSDTDYARTKNELRELVTLRNDLVHHFIEQHDIWSVDGCVRASAALVAAYRHIDQCCEQLREWAEDMEQARRLAAEAIQSDALHDLFVNGIAPDGTVYWPAAGIVSALRHAAGELAVDGWASIAEAGEWIAERFPEQLPAKYGCRGWRQVVHESRIFDLRYFEINGQRSARYREKESLANTG